jgi:hypothetical protein
VLIPSKIVVSLLLLSIHLNAVDFPLYQTSNDHQVCLEQRINLSLCLKRATTWLDRHPSDSFLFGERTRLLANGISAFQFFKKAFLDKSKFKCSSKQLTISLLNTLSSKATTSEDIKISNKIIFNQCSSQLQSEVLNKAMPGSPLFSRTCENLMKRGLIKGVKLKKCRERHSSKE